MTEERTTRAAEAGSHKLGATDTDIVYQSYSEIELPERLHESLALFLRLERSVLTRLRPAHLRFV